MHCLPYTITDLNLKIYIFNNNRKAEKYSKCKRNFWFGCWFEKWFRLVSKWCCRFVAVKRKCIQKFRAKLRSQFTRPTMTDHRMTKQWANLKSRYTYIGSGFLSNDAKEFQTPKPYLISYNRHVACNSVLNNLINSNFLIYIQSVRYQNWQKSIRTLPKKNVSARHKMKTFFGHACAVWSASLFCIAKIMGCKSN